MACRIAFAVFLISCGASLPAGADDGAASGRMICEVVGSRIVPAGETPPVIGSRVRDDFPAGSLLVVEYGLDEASGLTIHLGEPAGQTTLIDETFSAGGFRGVSRVSNIAEFRAAYSEASFGQYHLNYKGSDQLFIKNRCDGRKWSGHFVRTHLSALFTEVVSFDCRHTVDARDEIVARLSAMN